MKYLNLLVLFCIFFLFGHRLHVNIAIHDENDSPIVSYTLYNKRRRKKETLAVRGNGGFLSLLSVYPDIFFSWFFKNQEFCYLQGTPPQVIQAGWHFFKNIETEQILQEQNSCRQILMDNLNFDTMPLHFLVKM